MLKLTYIADKSQPLLAFLKSREISKKAVTALKHRGGRIEVNGTPQTVHYPLAPEDEIGIYFPKEDRGSGLSPWDFPLSIVFEDDYLLVLNKPAGIPVIPTLRYPEKTLANALIHYYDEIGIPSTIHFVNRLDKDTSGLLIVAKYRHIHHLLTKDIKQIQRRYLARVIGTPNPPSGLIDAPIARLQEGSVKRGIHPDGQPARTHYQLLDSHPPHLPNTSTIECRLETGRTHQIRVHMSHLGHPLLGDTLYGGPPGETTPGQHLHSYYLSFTHPLTKKTHTFTASPKEGNFR